MATKLNKCRSCTKILAKRGLVCRSCGAQVRKLTWVKLGILVISAIDVVGMVSPPKEDMRNSLTQIDLTAAGDVRKRE